MGSNPKMWAWGAGILGIILVVCGFLSQTPQTPSNDKCHASNYTWASVIIGFIMLLAGFMTLMKMTKKPAAGIAGATADMPPAAADAGAAADMPPM